MGKEKITLAVTTDLHYLSSELRDDGEAFELMTRFSDGALTGYGDEIFAVFITEMTKLHPDAVLVTGDLSFNGEKKSHEHLAEGFEQLRREGIPVLLFPGNHDLDNPMSGSYLGSEALPVENISRDDFRRMYAVPSSDEGKFLHPDDHSLSFVYALSDDLWLVCTDINGNGMPGKLTDEVLSWAETVLEEARSKNIRVIGVTHQDIFAHNGLLSAGFVMEGAGCLVDLYRENGVHLNLGGHMHIQHIREENGLTEIVTSALMIPPCQYGILTIEGDLAAYHSKVMDVAAWAAETGSSDPNLLAFPAFASSFYMDAQRRRLEPELEDLRIPESEREALICSMGSLNQAFFAGTLSGLKERDRFRSMWQERLSGNFWNDYIDSIFDEGIKDERNAVVSLR